MHREVIAAVMSIFFVVLFIGCTVQAPTCAPPYIPNGNSCCADKNNDSTCDARTLADEVATSCDLCPPKFVTQKEEVIRFKYVCPNESIMDTAQACGVKITSNAKLFTVSKEQDETYIGTFSVDAACRGKYKSAEAHLSLLQTPQSITFQILDTPSGSFRDLTSVPVKKDVYYYVGFCDEECMGLTDTQLTADTAYVLRAVMQYADRKVYTRDFIIDPTPEGDIGKKTCT